MKKNFLLASWLFGFGNSLSAPLLGLYIYVNSSIVYTLKFVLVTSLFILIGYLTVGYLVSIWNSAITYIKIGIGLFIAFYLLLLTLGNEVSHYVSFMGMLYGLAQGFYWCGWDIVFYYTPNKLKFFNNSTYLSLITSLVSPAVYGSILTIFRNSGYEILFAFTSAFLVLTFLLMDSVRVTAKSNVTRSITVIKDDKVYRVTMSALTLAGGANYVLGNLNPILIYNVSKSYLNFTLINYGLSILSVISVFILRDRLINKIKPHRLVLLSSLALLLSGASLFFYPIIYLVTFYTTSPLIYPIIDIYNWNNMNRNFLMDYLINRQILLNAGRMTFSLLEIAILSPYVGGEIAVMLPFVSIASLIFAKNVKQPIS